MNFKKLTLAALFSVGVLGIDGLPVNAQEGILFKQRAGDSNYCHLKFPAIREDTLASNRPVLKDARTGDIVDFYGPCDFDPTGRVAAQAQKLDEWNRDTRDGE